MKVTLAVSTLQGPRGPVLLARGPRRVSSSSRYARLVWDALRGGGFDCRRFQVEQPAAFKAPPSENGGCAWIFGTKSGFLGVEGGGRRGAARVRRRPLRGSASARPLAESHPQPVSSSPLIEPDVRISRIRLSDRFHVEHSA